MEMLTLDLQKLILSNWWHAKVEVVWIHFINTRVKDNKEAEEKDETLGTLSRRRDAYKVKYNLTKT